MSETTLMINDGQARRIASEWHGGMSSALYSHRRARLTSSAHATRSRANSGNWTSEKYDANCSRWTGTYGRSARVPRKRDGLACGTSRR